jgi:CRP/FNR family transcriptional regulator, cyclic AMP receptor protein
MDVTKLDGLELFDGLSRPQLEMIAQHAVEVDVPEGKVLVHDGALAWDFYVIEEGSAEVRRGQTTKLGTLGAGDFFGEMGVMASDQRRTASVVTTSPMRAIRLTTHQLRMIAHELPDFAERLRAAIAEREQHLL